MVMKIQVAEFCLMQHGKVKIKHPKTSLQQYGVIIQNTDI